MKPFITPKISKLGKKLLQFQLEGADHEYLLSVMYSHSITAYSMPEGHTFNAAWIFRLHFDDDNFFVEFSSASTLVAGWQEAGSLNIRLAFCEEWAKTSAAPVQSIPVVPSLRVGGFEKIVYEDDEIISECGIVINGLDGQSVVVAAGIPPGSVSVAAPFAIGPFSPQFSLEACRRESLVQSGLQNH